MRRKTSSKYHSELVQQIKLVKMQGESMGLDTVVPPWMEQSLLLIAAWQHEDYKKIAMEFTMEGKAFTVDALIRELRKQQLLKAHLNGADAQGKASSSSEPLVRVKAAKEATGKPCFAFQRGTCARPDCPYSHVIEKKPAPKTTKGEKPGSAPPKATPAVTCSNCGDRHTRAECKFSGSCSWCKQKGHKEAQCRGKQQGKAKAMLIDECVEVRFCAALDHRYVALQAAPAGERVASAAHVSQSSPAIEAKANSVGDERVEGGHHVATSTSHALGECTQAKPVAQRAAHVAHEAMKPKTSLVMATSVDERVEGGYHVATSTSHALDQSAQAAPVVQCGARVAHVVTQPQAPVAKADIGADRSEVQASASHDECTTPRVSAAQPGPVAHVLVAEESEPAAAVLQARSSANSTRWCIDSGANRDICKEYELFGGKAAPKVIAIGEAGTGHSFTSKAEGSIPFKHKGEAMPLFTRAIYADQVSENIMSVAEAVDNGFSILFTKEGVHMYRASECVVQGKAMLAGTRDPRTRLFYMNFASPSPCIAQRVAIPQVSLLSTAIGMESRRMIYDNRRARASKADTVEEPADVSANLSKTYHEYKTDFDLWHPRMAHINPRMAKRAMPDLKDWPAKSHCDGCTQGKLHKFGHHGSRPTVTETPWAPGEYLTCDLFGPVVRSCGGAKYVAFYIDIRSKFVYAKALQAKTDHYQAFAEVIVDVRARSGRPMRFFKTDGDGIFTGKDALDTYAKHAIRHVRSAPGDSSSNDVAERTIRTFVELMRTNLLHANAPPCYWVEALGMVEYVWNHIDVIPDTQGLLWSRTSTLEGHHRRYDLSILRAFGTKCHFLLTAQKKGGRKLAVDAKGRLGIIFGIEDAMPAYRVLDVQMRKVRCIPFAQLISHEGHYPFRN